MYLEKIDRKTVENFFEREFGKITDVKELYTKHGTLFYLFSFKLKENGVYEEIFAYGNEIRPVGIDSMSESKIKLLDEKYKEMVKDNLSFCDRDNYERYYKNKKIIESLKNKNEL